MTRFIKVVFLVVICVLTPTCGDENDPLENGLVDDKYQGEPLAELTGTISIVAPDEIPDHISLGLLWAGKANSDFHEVDFEGDNSDESECDGTIAEHQTVQFTEDTTDFYPMQSVEFEVSSLVEFTLPIHELPPEAAWWDLAEMGGTGRAAFGLVVAFSDLNGNGIFDRGTPTGLADRLLSASYYYSEADDTEYLAQIVFLDGEFGDSEFSIDLYEQYDLEQGFNLLVETNDGVSVEALSHPIQLSPINSEQLGAELVEMQCSEIEYLIDFNGPVPDPLEGDLIWMTCSESGDGVPTVDVDTGGGEPTEETDTDGGVVTGEEGEDDVLDPDPEWTEEDTDMGDFDPIDVSMEWYAVAPTDNACRIHETRGFACFDEGVEIPAEWEALCFGK